MGSVLSIPTAYAVDPDPNELNLLLKWPRSLAVYDQMLTESQVISVLRAVKLPIMATRWRIDPSGARDEVTERVARSLGLTIVGQDEPPKRRTAGRFSWRQHLNWALLSLRYGHMPFEQIYQVGADGKYDLKELSPRMPRRLRRINVDTDGQLVSIEQNPAFDNNGMPTGVGSIAIPSDRLVMYVNEQEPGDWIGRSLLRAAYKNYVIKDELLRIQAATIKRNGMGIPVYTGATAGEDLRTGLGIATRYRAGDNSGTALPFGARLELLGVQGVLPNAEPAIQYHDAQMARAVLAHFLNLGQQTGSWALGSAFQDFFVMSLQSVAQDICDTAQGHIVEDLVDVNYSIDENAPTLVFEPIGSQQPITAGILLALRQAGMLIPDRELEQHVRDLFQLPEKTVPSPTNPAYPTDETPPVPAKDLPAGGDAAGVEQQPTDGGS
jgi:hypothetical protein